MAIKDTNPYVEEELLVSSAGSVAIGPGVYALGKRRTYISPDSYLRTTRDLFRVLMGQYWETQLIVGEETLVYGQNLTKLEEGVPTVVSIDPQELFGASAFEKNRSLTLTKTDELSSTKEPEIKIAKLVVQGSLADYQTLTKFSGDMGELFKNSALLGVADYYYCEGFKYVVDEDPLSVSATSKYNFFVEEYESLTRSLQESVIPNFYAVSLYEFDVGPLDPTVSVPRIGLYDEMVNHVLLYNKNSSLSEAILDNGVDPDLNDPLVTLNEYEHSLGVPYKDYLREWSAAYADLDFQEESDLISQGKNIIQTHQSYSIGIPGSFSGASIQDLNERSLKMPFHVNLSLSAEGKEDVGSLGNIADTLGDLRLSPTWISHIISSLDSSLLVDQAYEDTYEFSSTTYYHESGEARSLMASPILKLGPRYNSVSHLDIEAANLLSRGYEDTIAENSFDIDKKLILDTVWSQETSHARGLSEDYESYITDVGNGLADSLAGHQSLIHGSSDGFEEKLLGTSTFSSRLYDEVFQDGILSENQTFAYRVKKHRGPTTAGTLVQDIWIPNAVSFMEYVDTQVRYGEQYTYDIYSYKYVFGVKYQYKQIVPPTIDTVLTSVDDGDEQLIGYNFSWFGAKNLFDIDPTDGIYIWQKAALYFNDNSLNSISQDNRGTLTDTFWIFNHFLDDVNYEVPRPIIRPNDGGVDMSTWPAWSPKATRFFSLGEIRDIMSQAWIVRPKGVVSSFDSWQEMWGMDWNDAWIDGDTPMVGGLTRLELDYLLRGINSPADYDPSTFSIENWFHLFMGYDGGTSATPTSVVPVEGIDYAIYDNAPQKTPPSHHMLNATYLGWDSAGPELGTVVIPPHHLRSFSGLESEGFSTRAFPGTGLGMGSGFHSTGLGVSELLAGEGIPLVETSGFRAEYEVEMQPCTRIVEAPYATLTTSVLSNPPPPPEVEIIPYRGVNNQLLFTFDATVAERRIVAIPITQSDEALFEKHYQAQGLDSGSELLFKSDDIPSYFEVFRLDSAPSSYSDFEDQRRAKVSTLIRDENRVIRSRSSDYTDALQPNVKYYYTFRTVDFHDNVSNPTFIYEVELVDDGGAVYPIVNLYQLPVVGGSVPTKTLKKILQVYPSLEQVTAKLDSNLVDGSGNEYQDPNDVSDVVLGSEALEDSVWGKTFKIRLTSKKTGKKIDMNVTLEKKDDRS